MATELDAELDEVVDPVLGDPSLNFGAQRARQFQEDTRYRNRLFAGAAGRVNAAENLVKSLEANRQMNEARAYSDAAKMLSGLQTPQGPTESMAALGVTEDLAGQAARIRAEQLQRSAESIYGAEDAVSSRMMEEAEVRKGASVFAERQAKMANFMQSMSGIRADMDADIIDGDQAWRQIKALVELEQDPYLKQQYLLAWQGTSPNFSGNPMMDEQVDIDVDVPDQVM